MKREQNKYTEHINNNLLLLQVSKQQDSSLEANRSSGNQEITSTVQNPHGW